MLRITFLFFFLFFFFSVSQNEYKNGEREGFWIGYYDTGELRYEGVFLNGKEKGIFKFYYKSGNIEKELLYVTPGIHSKVRFFYSNKMIKAFGEYCSKKRCGTWEYFDINGQLISVENYKNGFLEGDVLEYFNGSLKNTYIYVNDKKNGFSKSFFSSGKLKVINYYLNDKLHGEYSVFMEDGTLIEKGNYINDFRDGVWYIYFPIKKKIKYKNGKVIK